MPKKGSGRKKVAENIHRTEAGTYEVKMSIRGRQVKRRAKTYQLALRIRRELDLARSLGESMGSPDQPELRMTFGEYVREIWMPGNLGTGRLAPSTETQYRDMAKWLTRPAAGLPQGLGAVELNAIGRKEIAAFARMMAKTIQQSTAAKHLKNARCILRAAKEEGYLSEVPSGSGLLRKPHRSVRESWVWRKEEVRSALSYLRSVSDARGLWQGHPVLLALLLFACCGARRSEVFGLRWSDVQLPGADPNSRVASLRRPAEGTAAISIRRQVRWGSPTWSLERLKTAAARRRIEIVHPTLVQALRRHKTLCMVSSLNLVLTNFGRRKGPAPYGAPGCPIAKRIGQVAAELGIRKEPETEAEKEAGLGRPKTPHGLRHYFASTLIELGEDPVYVSRLLGHASPDITYKIYAWALKTSRPDSSLRLQAGLLDGLDLLKAEGED